VTCSFDVPPGTYELRLALGSRERDARTGVRVEARRTVLAPVTTAAGQIVDRCVTVSVRTPESMPDGQEGDGTPGLQVSLTGDAPALAGIEVLPRPQALRVLVVSDSTASDWLFGPQRGWGQELPQLFRTGLCVANYAASGSSTVSWLEDPTLFAAVRPLIRPGDQVLIQLAHNDRTTPEDVYRSNLRTLVDGSRAMGGLAVLVTPPCRRLFAPDGSVTPDGRVTNQLGVDLPRVVRELAAELHAPLLDLTARSQALLEDLGEADSWDLYLTAERDGVQDATHFCERGATAMARLVAEEIRAAGLPAAAYLHCPGE
jgi:lysophospholipase L1-like esterase